MSNIHQKNARSRGLTGFFVELFTLKCHPNPDLPVGSPNNPLYRPPNPLNNCRIRVICTPVKSPLVFDRCLLHLVSLQIVNFSPRYV